MLSTISISSFLHLISLTCDGRLGSPCQHEEQADEVEEEYLVVPDADAVINPGAVMIEASHAAVARSTVLGAKGTTDLRSSDN